MYIAALAECLTWEKGRFSADVFISPPQRTKEITEMLGRIFLDFTIYLSA